MAQGRNPFICYDGHILGGPKIGDKISDGTIYAGISPETGTPMYTTPEDAPLTCTFNKASEYAAGLSAHGHQDWRLPTKAELNGLFDNRIAIGGFKINGPYPEVRYWSGSSVDESRAWGQRFNDGRQYPNDDKNFRSSVRCVRDYSPAASVAEGRAF